MRSLRLLLVLPLALTACFFPADRGRALEARVEQLEQDKSRMEAELQQARQQLSATLPQIDEKVAEVTRALASLDTASRRSSADIGVQLQKAVEDVAELRGQVETYLYKIGELESALARYTEEQNKKLLELQGSDAVKAAEARRKAEELPRPADKKDFLALAQRQQQEGEAGVARQLYGEFLKKWPRDPLAGEAHFGLGEGYLAENKCREALFEYGKVVQEFPRAPSAPRAYLRSSECFRTLKMNDEARLALEEVIRLHPKSEAAKAARAQLAELNKKKPAPAKKKGAK